MKLTPSRSGRTDTYRSESDRRENGGRRIPPSTLHDAPEPWPAPFAEPPNHRSPRPLGWRPVPSISPCTEATTPHQQSPLTRESSGGSPFRRDAVPQLGRYCADQQRRFFICDSGRATRRLWTCHPARSALTSRPPGCATKYESPASQDLNDTRDSRNQTGNRRPTPSAGYRARECRPHP